MDFLSKIATSLNDLLDTKSVDGDAELMHSAFEDSGTFPDNLNGEHFIADQENRDMSEAELLSAQDKKIAKLEAKASVLVDRVADQGRSIHAFASARPLAKMINDDKRKIASFTSSIQLPITSQGSPLLNAHKVSWNSADNVRVNGYAHADEIDEPQRSRLGRQEKKIAELENTISKLLGQIASQELNLQHAKIGGETLKTPGSNSEVHRLVHAMSATLESRSAEQFAQLAAHKKKLLKLEARLSELFNKIVDHERRLQDRRHISFEPEGLNKDLRLEIAELRRNQDEDRKVIAALVAYKEGADKKLVAMTQMQEDLSNRLAVLDALQEQQSVKWAVAKQYPPHAASALYESTPLPGHTDGVRSVTFSPSNTYIASGSADNTIKIWDCETEQCIGTLAAHSEVVTSVAFSPDESTVISGSMDRTIRVWDLESRKCTSVLRDHNTAVRGVTFRPDGSMFASVGDNKAVTLWSMTSMSITISTKCHSDDATCVAFSPCGMRVASGSKDKTVKICYVSNGQCIATLKGHSNTVDSVAFSPDGLWIASASWDTSIRVWDATTYQVSVKLGGHDSVVRSISFHPDGSRLASGARDGSVRIWGKNSTSREGSWEKASCMAVLKKHSDDVRCVAFSPDGTKLASGSQDALVCLWLT